MSFKTKQVRPDSVNFFPFQTTPSPDVVLNLPLISGCAEPKNEKSGIKLRYP
jgi:hypothetical protein